MKTDEQKTPGGAMSAPRKSEHSAISWIKKIMADKGIDQPQLDELTTQYGARIAQTTASLYLSGKRPIQSLGPDRLEALRKALGVSPDEFVRGTQLSLIVPTSVQDLTSPKVLQDGMFPGTKQIGGQIMSVQGVAHGSIASSQSHTDLQIKSDFVPDRHITEDLRLYEYHGDDIYGPEDESLQDGNLIHVHTNDQTVVAGEIYVFEANGVILVKRARVSLGVMCLMSENPDEEFRVTEVKIIGRVDGGQPPYKQFRRKS
jgi:transcriptional regulator with XRE-family HTH domain